MDAKGNGLGKISNPHSSLCVIGGAKDRRGQLCIQGCASESDWELALRANRSSSLLQQYPFTGHKKCVAHHASPCFRFKRFGVAGKCVF